MYRLFLLITVLFLPLSFVQANNNFVLQKYVKEEDTTNSIELTRNNGFYMHLNMRGNGGYDHVYIRADSWQPNYGDGVGVAGVYSPPNENGETTLTWWYVIYIDADTIEVAGAADLYDPSNALSRINEVKNPSRWSAKINQVSPEGVFSNLGNPIENVSTSSSSSSNQSSNLTPADSSPAPDDGGGCFLKFL